ncbi:hypothetical protein BGZ65_006229 [Modicella reniformis]|uniref:Uncharacterized protein n=1 Tax=Modicella reniformis TaxID=1440133 RepID=A0A9P6IWF5_9FUNG|nr:hypothetical protein BGZ65_006229 [Modicella reniformis]
MAMEDIRTNFNLSTNFTKSDLQEMLDKAVPMKSNLDCWKEEHQQHFVDVWNRGIKDARDKGSDETPDDDDAAAMVEEKKNTRNCTTTLRQILRPDLKDQYDNINTIAMHRQAALTDCIDELSALSHKAVLAVCEELMTIASGQIIEETTAPSTSFEITSVLPPNFELRSDVNTRLDVSPLSESLQDHLESVLEDPKTKDDIATLLTQPFLQYLYSCFLGPRRQTTMNTIEGETESDSKNKTTWARIVKMIKQDIDFQEPPQAPHGISNTVSEKIREYSTATGNLWGGQSFWIIFLEFSYDSTSRQ